MNLATNLSGRLRNTNLPTSKALYPVFEAVVNSIQAIDEKNNLDSGSIVLEIIRNSQQSIKGAGFSETLENITGFTIKDNGIGFGDKNIKSFNTLDSDHKIDKGCKGIGRLLWLKAFSKVEIYSTFKDEKNKLENKFFKFDETQGFAPIDDYTSSNTDIKTTVRLIDFREKYQKYTPKSADSIANSLLEHCLWYFVRADGVPEIIVKDKDSSENINLRDLYDSYMHSSAYSETITIKENKFNLIHLKFRASSSQKHGIALCAASRVVREESIEGKITGLYGNISDSNGDFIYHCYVSSEYLDKKARSERTSFNIPKNTTSLFSETEISLKDIRENVLERSKEYLNDYLGENIKGGRKRVNDFISEKAPRYRPIIARINEDDLVVNPAISDKDLELHLHQQLSKTERDMLEQGHDIMTNFGDDIEDYQKRLRKYLDTAEDIKKSDLANYVSHRRVILDLLEKLIAQDSEGSYAKEELIHELIMPMGRTSDEVHPDDCNLWLIDEKLAFHNHLASDKTLKSQTITGDTSTKKPDLCALNIYNNPILVNNKQSFPLASITIIELKRPMRNDAKASEEKDPVEQAFGYLERIRAGNVKTLDGRLIPESKDIPGYIYAICDLTTSVTKRCKNLNLQATSDHMGYFGYNSNYKAYIEVISYNKLVQMAKERNYAFFEKLGLPTM